MLFHRITHKKHIFAIIKKKYAGIFALAQRKLTNQSLSLIYTSDFEELTMLSDQHNCIVCEQSSQEIPLLSIESQGKQYWICPQHLPVLIHEPAQLIGKLPGAEKLQGHQH